MKRITPLSSAELQPPWCGEARTFGTGPSTSQIEWKPWPTGQPSVGVSSTTWWPALNNEA